MNKKYWLRGGIITSIICVLYILVAMSEASFLPENFYTPIRSIVSFFTSIVEFVSQGQSFCHGWDVIGCAILPSLICILTISFFLGALLGWIYGKIKRN